MHAIAKKLKYEICSWVYGIIVLNIPKYIIQ